MKLSGPAANRYSRAPDAGATGLLIFGADAMRVALKRQEVVAALIGPEGEGEMRLTRISASELRKDGALLQDAVKAVGFFPGLRVVLVEDAADGLAPVIGAALKDWRKGDAQVVVTAGQLPAKSALRKLFEDHGSAPAIGIYDDPPSREEIEEALKAAGLGQIDGQAMTDLLALSRDLDPGDFRQTVEKIGLYKWRDETPLTPADVEACAPVTIEADLDDALHAAAEGQAGLIGGVMRRLEGQGITAVALCIGALRHFRALHAAASDPGGVAAGIARMRPPIFGPRRDRLQRQAQGWSRERLEEALALIVETDLTLRSTSRAPGFALVERAFIRLAMMKRR